MQFGLFGSAAARRGGPEFDSSEGFRDFVEYNIEAEALGFHSTFVVEHHFTGYGQVSATLNLLTWLGARTRRLRLGTAVIVLAPHRLCGSFAALSLELRRLEVSFNRLAPASPWLFDGLVIRASTVRNQLGRMGVSIIICAAIEPSVPAFVYQTDQVLPTLVLLRHEFSAPPRRRYLLV